jgi:hypothetical protein
VVPFRLPEKPGGEDTYQLSLSVNKKPEALPDLTGTALPNWKAASTDRSRLYSNAGEPALEIPPRPRIGGFVAAEAPQPFEHVRTWFEQRLEQRSSQSTSRIRPVAILISWHIPCSLNASKTTQALIVSYDPRNRKEDRDVILVESSQPFSRVDRAHRGLGFRLRELGPAQTAGERWEWRRRRRSRRAEYRGSVGSGA